MALRPDRSQKPDDKKAGRDAAQQDVFLREVDDALRQDEMLGAWQRFGKPAIAAILIGLAGFGGFLWWKGDQARQAGEHGEQMTLALDKIEQGQLDAADKQLTTLTKASAAGTRSSAQLLQAGLALQRGNRDAALALYNKVSADDDAPQPFRDLAAIRAVAVNFDTLTPQQTIDRLKGLAMPGNPWFGSAGELVGMAYLKQGKPELAGPLFAAISRDKDAPQTLRSRARQLAGLLGVDAIDDTAKAASGEQP